MTVAFVNEEFPALAGYGLRGGPRMSLAVAENPDSGTQERAKRWPIYRWEFELSLGSQNPKDLDTLDSAYEHYLAVGTENAFPLKDPNDFTSAANHRDAPGGTGMDQVIGVGDSTNGTNGTALWQLIKTYTFGARNYVRNIRRVVGGTLFVSVAGTLKTFGTHYTFNASTGEITFSAGNVPTTGQIIRASYEYRLAALYGAEFHYKTQRDAIKGGRVTDVTLIEDVDQGALTPEFPNMGGGTTVAFSAKIAYSYDWGSSVLLSPSTTGLELVLPDINDFPFGGPYLWFYGIQAGRSVVFKNRTGATEFTLPANTLVGILVQRDTGDVKKWVAG